MMKCSELLTAYFDFLKDAASCEPAPNGWLSVVLPFLYPDHDNIEIFVKGNAEAVVISDRGETLRRLDTIGIDIRTSGRVAYQVERIAKGFQVSMDNGAFFKEGQRSEIGAMAFDVLSACMAVGDLAYNSRAYQPLTFEEEVAKVLTTNNFDYEKGRPVKGRSLREYKLDFVVKTQHRVSYVQAMDARTATGVRAWVNATVVMWSDIEIGRGQVVQKVSLLNDETSEIKEEDVRLLGRDSMVYRWTEQAAFIHSLNAKGKGKKTRSKTEAQ